MLRAAEAGNEDAVCAGLKIGFPALQGVAQSFFRWDAGLPVGVRAGVDHQMNARGVGSSARGLDPRNLLPQWKQRAAVADRAGIFGIGIFKTGVLKIGALGDNGILTIGTGTISADTILRFG